MEITSHSQIPSFKHLLISAFNLYKKHANLFALLALLPIIFTSAVPLLLRGVGADVTGAVFSIFGLVLGLIGVILTAIQPIVVASAIRDIETSKPVDVSIAYKQGLKLFFPFIWVAILHCLVLMGASVFLIIPAIILSVYLSFASFAFVFENKRGFDALISSFNLVKGRFFIVLGKIIALIVTFVIAGGIVGILIAIIAGIAGISIEGINFLTTLVNGVFFIPIAYIFVYNLYHSLAKSNVHQTVSDKNRELKFWAIFSIVVAIVMYGAFVLFALSVVTHGGFRGQYQMHRNAMMTQSLRY